ncbi:substrate-binding domain-containing protein [Opitutus sp. GAS368]|uniref:PstS family phosphate ABC transporter substrate-binding protein n=1 Tax=Opitutus sp. GAS368 TaxID=1882749 RepID=UPI00087CB5B8|nr:substrate-binding domain-containing protein [Opitutus sp. GAS368]SDR69871.1 phosphate transport system substrate-binding protein [Opitutus sp. GAS368]
MKRIARALILSALAVVATAAEIRVVGSDLLGDDFVRAVDGFARQDDTAVKLDLRGTRPGSEDLAAGRADVGIFLLPASEPPPVGAVVSRVMGYQVVVVVVPATSPLSQVTTGQLRGIFGEAAAGFTRWGDLNLPGEWAARPIALKAVAPADDLAWPLFQRVILQDAVAKAGVEFSADGAMLAQRLRTAENSIGVAGAGVAGSPGLRVLALAAGPAEPAYGPTAENVHRGSYPLRLVLYVAFRRTAAPDLQRFLKFLLADETAATLAPAGFLPLPVGVRNQLVFELEELK